MILSRKQTSHVSTTSILRFCQKLRFDGFTEFKIKLRLYLESSENSNILNKKSSLNEFLERILNQNFDNKINEIATVIAKSENIIYLGNGTSGILARFGALHFSGLKKFFFHINDLSMLQRAGRAVAMENAPDQIKAVCSHTTATNDKHSVALAIDSSFEISIKRIGFV